MFPQPNSDPVKEIQQSDRDPKLDSNLDSVQSQLQELPGDPYGEDKMSKQPRENPRPVTTSEELTKHIPEVNSDSKKRTRIEPKENLIED